jgi:hypothetical protein
MNNPHPILILQHFYQFTSKTVMRCHSCASLTDVLILLGAIDGFHQEAAGPSSILNPYKVLPQSVLC